MADKKTSKAKAPRNPKPKKAAPKEMPLTNIETTPPATETK
jgi:hypothetical protein